MIGKRYSEKSDIEKRMDCLDRSERRREKKTGDREVVFSDKNNTSYAGDEIDFAASISDKKYQDPAVQCIQFLEIGEVVDIVRSRWQDTSMTASVFHSAVWIDYGGFRKSLEVPIEKLKSSKIISRNALISRVFGVSLYKIHSILFEIKNYVQELSIKAFH